MEIALAFVVSNKSFFRTVEHETFTFSPGTHLRNIIKSEHHILRRYRNRSSIGRIKNIMALKHKYLRFEHGLIAQRKMNSHLVSIEIGIECRTCQWMQLDGFAFDQFRLESLNAKTVKCRSTVKENRMTFHHILQDIPNNWFTTVNDLFRTLNRLYNASLYQFTNNKRLVKFGSHQFWKTALAHLQFRPDNDYRTCRIVNTFTKKILAETSLLSFQRV